MKDKPIVNGLVLAGGKSTRMGQDKSLLRWHKKEHCYFMADLLKEFCHEVYISCRPEQLADASPGYHLLFDKYDNAGPLGGLLSAFDANTICAWLAVACDMPLVNKATLRYLFQCRNASAVATAYKNPVDGMPEPLITIWEPEAYPLLQASLKEGGGPRKILLDNETEMIFAPDPSALLNANTPDEAIQLRQLLLL